MRNGFLILSSVLLLAGGAVRLSLMSNQQKTPMESTHITPAEVLALESGDIVVMNDDQPFRLLGVMIGEGQPVIHLRLGVTDVEICFVEDAESVRKLSRKIRQVIPYGAAEYADAARRMIVGNPPLQRNPSK